MRCAVDTTNTRLDEPASSACTTRIVAFEPAHAKGVVELILPIQQMEFGIPVSLNDQPDLQDIPGFYQRGYGNFWVALDNNEVVGSLALLDIGNGQAALRKMFVKSTHRGAEHGVARRLLRKAAAQPLRQQAAGETHPAQQGLNSSHGGWWR